MVYSSYWRVCCIFIFLFFFWRSGPYRIKSGDIEWQFNLHKAIPTYNGVYVCETDTCTVQRISTVCTCFGVLSTEEYHELDSLLLIKSVD
jgi:hypothetical protein